MDSVVKPLLTQVKAINAHYDQVVQGLATGDPRAKQMLNDLARGVRQLFAHFNSSTNTMKSNVQMAPGLQPVSMTKMITFYVQEVVLVIQLFVQLMLLVNNILSLRTIIDFIMKDLIAFQQYLQARMLYVEHAINRAAQKIQKNIEWVKTAATISISEAFSNQQLSYYKAQLSAAQKASSATPTTTTTTTHAPTTPVATHSTPAAAVALGDSNPQIQAQQQQTQQAQTQAVVSALQAKVDSIKTDLASYPVQRAAIVTDKAYWNAKWDAQAKADQQLLNSAPKQGINYNGS